MGFLGFPWVYWPASLTFHHSEHTVKLTTKSQGEIDLEKLCTELITPFKAHPLYCTGLLQTFRTTLPSIDIPIVYSREIIQAKDGGSYTIDYVVDQHTPAQSEATELPPRTRFLTTEQVDELGSETDSTPMIICLHGLTGGSYEVYVKAAIEPLVKSREDGGYGFAACVLNARGCANSKITTTCLFNARFTADLRNTIRIFRKRWPKRPLFAAGFSLGANILANFLGEEGHDCLLNAAVLVSSPHNLDVASKFMHNSYIGREVLSATMTRNLKGLFERNFDVLVQHPSVNPEKIRNTRYLYEFDREFTARIFGFQTQDDYYRTASSSGNLLKIRTPTLILNAVDDPISVEQALPYSEAVANQYLFMALTSIGGHLSWFDYQGGRWYPKQVATFLDKMARDVISVSHNAGIEEPAQSFIQSNGELREDVANGSA